MAMIASHNGRMPRSALATLLVVGALACSSKGNSDGSGGSGAGDGAGGAAGGQAEGGAGAEPAGGGGADASGGTPQSGTGGAAGTGGTGGTASGGAGGQAGKPATGGSGGTAGAAGGAGGVFVGDPTKQWNFMWVGNSFTFNSGAALKTKELMNSGRAVSAVVRADLSVNWYRGLYYHWNFGTNVAGGNTLTMIRSNLYSHVVLQDFMLHPTSKDQPNQTTGEGTYGVEIASDYGKRFIDEIKKNNKVPIVWAIWPEQDKQTDWDALIKAYRKIAEDNGAVFVPGSAAWLLALKERPALAFWDTDKFHPSGLGGYACACVFYAVLTGKTPVGNQFVSDNIDADTARFVQEKAWQAYQMYGINPAAP